MINCSRVNNTCKLSLIDESLPSLATHLGSAHMSWQLKYVKLGGRYVVDICLQLLDIDRYFVPKPARPTSLNQRKPRFIPSGSTTVNLCRQQDLTVSVDFWQCLSHHSWDPTKGRWLDISRNPLIVEMYLVLNFFV